MANTAAATSRRVPVVALNSSTSDSPVETNAVTSSRVKDASPSQAPPHDLRSRAEFPLYRSALTALKVAVPDCVQPLQSEPICLFEEYKERISPHLYIALFLKSYPGNQVRLQSCSTHRRTSSITASTCFGVMPSSSRIYSADSLPMRAMTLFITFLIFAIMGSCSANIFSILTANSEQLVRGFAFVVNEVDAATTLVKDVSQGQKRESEIAAQRHQKEINVAIVIYGLTELIAPFAILIAFHVLKNARAELASARTRSSASRSSTFLGCEFIMKKPESDTGESDSGEKVSCGLATACGGASEVFAFVEEALDEVVFSVEHRIDVALTMRSFRVGM